MWNKGPKFKKCTVLSLELISHKKWKWNDRQVDANRRQWEEETKEKAVGVKARKVILLLKVSFLLFDSLNVLKEWILCCTVEVKMWQVKSEDRQHKRVMISSVTVASYSINVCSWFIFLLIRQILCDFPLFYERELSLEQLFSPGARSVALGKAAMACRYADWNVSTSSWWIPMTFWADIQAPQKMIYNHLGSHHHNHIKLVSNTLLFQTWLMNKWHFLFNLRCIWILEMYQKRCLHSAQHSSFLALFHRILILKDVEFSLSCEHMNEHEFVLHSMFSVNGKPFNVEIPVGYRGLLLSVGAEIIPWLDPILDHSSLRGRAVGLMWFHFLIEHPSQVVSRYLCLWPAMQLAHSSPLNLTESNFPQLPINAKKSCHKRAELCEPWLWHAAGNILLCVWSISAW